MARKTTRRSSSYNSGYSRSRGSARTRVSLRPWLIGGGAALFVLAVLFWYMLNGGWDRLGRSLYSLSANAGLKVEEVFISGRTYVDRDELLAELNIDRGDPILALDLTALHATLVRNPWIAGARIERHLPNVVYIALTERVPFARWQNEQKLSLVDSTGAVLSTDPQVIARFPDLPLVVGTGAGKTANRILTVLDGFPEFGKQLEALVRVGDRRWDLRLQNGITIKLPDSNPVDALQRVSTTWHTADFVGKGTKLIDARLPDRLIIDSTEGKAEEQ